jgi:membrane protease YdiL (CAAX protease family)
MARPTAPARSRLASSKRALRGFLRRANLLTSLVVVFPLFLAYQLAVVALPDALNGADLFTGRMLALLGGARNYLLFNLGLLVAFVGLLVALRKKQRFDLGLFAPVVLESTVYALSMGAVICYVMNAIGISPTLHIAGGHPSLAAAATPMELGLASRLALSLGAGVHEELVFRLGMVPGLTWLFEKGAGLGRVLGVLLAFVISSLVFSAAHHLIGGEPWRLGVFTYRFFCGIIFATLFQLRGLGVAVYTHALYDIYVMLFS